MTRVPPIIASVVAALVLGSSIAFGQYTAPPPNMYQEIVAAQESLEEAMRHLQNIRDPSYPVIDRAYALVLLAHTELGPTQPPTRGGGRSLPYGLE